MTRLVALFAALAVAGCATIDYKRQVTDEFVPPADKTADQLKQDWAGCNLSTATTKGSATASVYDQVFQLCMESKGYRLSGTQGAAQLCTATAPCSAGTKCSFMAGKDFGYCVPAK
jgi:uncharacterized lipoprotein YajG